MLNPFQDMPGMWLMAKFNHKFQEAEIFNTFFSIILFKYNHTWILSTFKHTETIYSEIVTDFFKVI